MRHEAVSVSVLSLEILLYLLHFLSYIMPPLHSNMKYFLVFTCFSASYRWMATLFNLASVSFAFFKPSLASGNAPLQSGPPHFLFPNLSRHKAPPHGAISHGKSQTVPQTYVKKKDTFRSSIIDKYNKIRWNIVLYAWNHGFQMLNE